MRLQKANQPTPSYPSKEGIKPILLSLTTMMALSACSQPISPLGVTTPPKKTSSVNIAEQMSQEANKTIVNHTSQPEVTEPEVLGGIPVPPPNQ